MNKNCLFISIDGLSDPLGQSQIIPYLKIISQKNNKVFVFSMEKENNLKNKKKKILNSFISQNINWKYSNYILGLGKFGNFISYLKLFFLCFHLVIFKNINVIHGRGHIPSLFGLLTKILFKNKLIFDCRGFWVDERVDNKALNLSNYFDRIIYKVNKYFEFKIFKYSDKIVCLTNKAKIEILKIIKDKKEEDIYVIPCCSDYNYFNIEHKKNNNKTIRKKLNIPSDSIVFTYSGSLGGVYLIDEMITFFNEYYKINKNIYFLIITNNIEIIQKKILDYNKKINSQKFIFINLDREQMPKYLSVTNIFLSFIMNTYARKAMSPTKISECLALGIPIIINKNIGDTEEIISYCNAGLAFDINEKNYSKKIINEIPNLIQLDEKNISYKSKKILDIKIAKIKYNKIYESF